MIEGGLWHYADYTVLITQLPLLYGPLCMHLPDVECAELLILQFRSYDTWQPGAPGALVELGSTLVIHKFDCGNVTGEFI